MALSDCKYVASRVGAWIETNVIYDGDVFKYVASRVGAWIETVILMLTKDFTTSRPVWARGLKLVKYVF